jgi:Fe-S oxidoreductase
MTTTLADYLEREVRAVTSACTACGKCVEVCPVVPYVDVGDATHEAVARGVVDFLEGTIDAPPSATTAWAHGCNGCGECIPVCPEGVNPRKMLVLLNTVRAPVEQVAPELFRKMSRAIRLMAGMQLVPAEFARVLTPPRTREAPVVFYLGCNALRTPHLLFNAMYVLDALGVDYEVVGGPGVCCGIIHAKWEGKIETGDRVTTGTLDRFASFKPTKVLTWCPSCQLHLGESVAGLRPTSFDLDHVTTFFVDRLAQLRPLLVREVPRRVVLHAHLGLTDLGRNVAALLEAIPGLTLLDTVFEPGYTCGGSGCSKAPKLMAIEHAKLLDRVRETGADTLVTFYHACHAAFVTEEKPGGLRVLNFTDLIVEGLGGTPHDDVLKRYRLADELRLVVEEGLPYLRANGIDVDAERLETMLPELFTLAEFRGGLSCFSSPT